MFSGCAAELERLRLHARVWERETERWPDEIGIQHGWVCAERPASKGGARRRILALTPSGMICRQTPSTSKVSILGLAK